MLNPQRWGATNSSASNAANGSRTASTSSFPSFARMSSWGAGGKDKDGYVRDFEKGGDRTLFDIGADEEDEEDEKGLGEVLDEKRASTATARCKCSRPLVRRGRADRNASSFANCIDYR